MHYTPKSGFPYYLNLANKDDLNQLFTSIDVFSFLNTISDEKSTYRYESNKWSIKQIIGHLADHERIKMFRAFLMSRNQSVELWGYDQDVLVKHSCFEEQTLKQLVTDFMNVRQSSISFIKSLSENQLTLKGYAKQHEVTLEDFLKSIIGHEKHHIEIIKNRYLL